MNKTNKSNLIRLIEMELGRQLPDIHSNTYPTKKSPIKSKAEEQLNKFTIVDQINECSTILLQILTDNDVNGADKNVINWSPLSDNQKIMINRIVEALRNLQSTFLK